MQQYTDEFKEQVLAECEQVGNAALVARRHQISENTIYTWMKNRRQNGSASALPKSKVKRLEELEKRLKPLILGADQL
jgi:transposase-like protein